MTPASSRTFRSTLLAERHLKSDAAFPFFGNTQEGFYSRVFIELIRVLQSRPDRVLGMSIVLIGFGNTQQHLFP